MKRILFVCTSNTCRSFFAEYLMKKMLEEAIEEEIVDRGEVKVSSAGLFAVEDDHPSEYATEVLYDIYGIETRHKARQLTEEAIEESDMIIAMEDGQRHTLIFAYPEAEDKIFTLKEIAFGPQGDEGDLDIADPYGGDLEEYTECAKEIEESLQKGFDLLIG